MILRSTFDRGIFVTEDICDLLALMYADDVSSLVKAPSNYSDKLIVFLNFAIQLI